MNVYTDPRLLDLAGAVERLPDLPLDAGDRDAGTAARATGTDAGTVQASPKLPPKAPLPVEHSCKFLTTASNNPQPTVELPKREDPRFLRENTGFLRLSGNDPTGSEQTAYYQRIPGYQEKVGAVSGAVWGQGGRFPGSVRDWLDACPVAIDQTARASIEAIVENALASVQP